MNTFMAVVMAASILAQRGQSPLTPEAMEKYPYEFQAPIQIGEHTSQTLAVNYYPDGPPRPCVIVIVSGAWHSAPMDGNYPTPEPFAELGYAYGFVTHRTGREHEHPAQIKDSLAGVNYIIEHAADWNIDPDKIALTGTSAGAHLAMLLAYHPKGADVAAVVSRGGPTDLSLGFVETINPNLDMKIFHGLFGERSAEDEEYLDKMMKVFSPVTYMTPGDPPTLFIVHRTDPPPSDPPPAKYGIHHHKFGEHALRLFEEAGCEGELFILEQEERKGTVDIEAEKAFLLKHLGAVEDAKPASQPSSAPKSGRARDR